MTVAYITQENHEDDEYGKPTVYCSEYRASLIQWLLDHGYVLQSDPKLCYYNKYVATSYHSTWVATIYEAITI